MQNDSQHTHIFRTHCTEFRFELLAGLTILCSEINGNNFGIKGLKNKNQGRFSPYPKLRLAARLAGKIEENFLMKIELPKQYPRILRLHPAMKRQTFVLDGLRDLLVLQGL